MGNVNIGKCYCCRITEIKQLTNYHCGHVKSEKNGGSIDIENLRPICSSCNLSMGMKHMRQYIFENYPKNIHDFDNKVSPIKNPKNIHDFNSVSTIKKTKKKFLGMF